MDERFKGEKSKVIEEKGGENFYDFRRGKEGFFKYDM